MCSMIQKRNFQIIFQSSLKSCRDIANEVDPNSDSTNIFSCFLYTMLDSTKALISTEFGEIRFLYVCSSVI